MKVTDDTFSARRPGGMMLSEAQGYTTGCVVTPHGLVAVYAQGDAHHHPYTSISIALGGRLYSRDFHGKRYSQRGIVTVAAKFASEIAGARNV